MRIIATSLTVAVLLSVPFCGQARTWYITPDGTGDAPTIQAGIDSAVTEDTVMLANGTFTGNGNRDIDFLGKPITVRSQSGNPETCIIDCEGTHRGFYMHSGEGFGSVLDGVMITNGYGYDGGAISCYWSSPTITNCMFSDNTGGIAGGMNCSSSAPTLTNCTFSGNAATICGGGIRISNCSPTFTNCTFSNNTSSTGGGMICLDSSPTLINCTFLGNEAQEEGGGGVSCDQNSPATLTHCTFSGNVAQMYGGGMFIARNSSATLTNCTFSSKRVCHT